MRNKFLWPFLSFHPSWDFIIGRGGGGCQVSTLSNMPGWFECQETVVFGKTLGKFYSNKEFCPSPDVQLFGWVEGVVVGIL